MHVFPSSPPFRLHLVSFVTAAVDTGLWKTLLLRSGRRIRAHSGKSPTSS